MIACIVFNCVLPVFNKEYDDDDNIQYKDIAFSCSLFSDKVDNRDGLNKLQMDAFGCMVQGSFLTYIFIFIHRRR